MRPTHAALDGLILPVDHPFWRTYTPPWAFNCRCSVIPMTAKTAQAAIAEAREKERPVDEVPSGIAAPAADWDYDRTDPAAPLEGLEKAVAQRIGICGPNQFAGKHRTLSNSVQCLDANLLARLTSIAATTLQVFAELPSPQRLANVLDMPSGLKAGKDIAAFMAEFGGNASGTIPWKSVFDQVLAISSGIFERHGGSSKLFAGGLNLRVLYLAHGIKTPDEVWYVSGMNSPGRLFYLAGVQAGTTQVDTLAVFKWDGQA